MRPFDFFLLAQRLVASEANPEGRRSAISRAYYGSFLCALDLLTGFGIRFDKHDFGTHKKVQDILAHSGDPAMKQVGVDLGNLRAQRNRADYRLDDRSVETEESAQKRLGEASDILAKIGTCRTSLDRAKLVRQRARTYAKDILKLDVGA